jgi:hypothetical protein
MATFIRLVDYNSSEEKEREFYNQENIFVVNEQDDFLKIPGSPIAYWVSNKVKKIFKIGHKFGDVAAPKQGLATGNNDKFLRYWHEINFMKMAISCPNEENVFSLNLKWIPHTKGGDFRKWYGNKEYVLAFDKENYATLLDLGNHLPSRRFYFLEGFNWSKTGSSKFAVRYVPKGFSFDSGCPTAFCKEDNLNYFVSLMNTKLIFILLQLINPTISFQVGDISRLPIIFPKSDQTKQTIDAITQHCINISKEEWDSRETSWDFKTNELLRHKISNRLEDAYNTYCTYWKDQFFKLHTNEEELNRIFIDIYDLADELTPDVPLEDITILKDESEIKDGELVFKKDVIIKQFISYAVGCMFGRYSPDREGLILANQGETIDDFMEKVPNPSFMPDDDNIIPILEDEYFTDDIVSRFKEFLKATFGADSLAENLDFIAGALSNSKNGTKSPEKTIRDYFLKSFFKDHVKTYKKRPIYWFFTSGKGRGFNALVYMHRYDKTTLAKMRTDYLLELESKLDARMDMLTPDSAKDKQEREMLSAQIEELAAYDEVLNNKALAYIDIDLDDGVVVNYAKFEGLVEKV